MDIQSAMAVNTNQLTIQAAQLNLSRLIIGQVLNAAVIGKKSSNSFILQIGNQQIEAKVTENKILNIGEQLKLIVEKQSDPTTLRVIQHDPKVVAQETRQQLLRENIPKQADLDKLTTTLSQISKNIKDSFKNLPAPIEQQFKKLIEILPTKNTLKTDNGVKTTIKNSGLFLEAKLLSEAFNKDGKKLNSFINNATQSYQKSSQQVLNQASNQTLIQDQHLDIAKDLKSNLLQLTDVINKYKQSKQNQKTPIETFAIKQPQLSTIGIANNNKPNIRENLAKVIELSLKTDTDTVSKQIESAVSRIEVNQSKAIVTNDNQSPIWSIETPVKDDKDFDLLKLDIQADRDSENDNKKENLWTTNIKIVFENIGTLSAKLSVIDKEVKASLWSDNEILNKLVDDNLTVLNKKIEQHGLTTGKIVCLKKAPVGKESSYSNNHLINITL